ncbi:MAG: response regulator [Elusimicrobia bacterium]|nr:response regulator [Elusimicrobiota bacterium]
MAETIKTKKIMILDDNANVLKILKRILEKKGYEIITFERPSHALKYALEEPLDLIITDLKMPEMDGLEFLVQMKTNFPELEVIMMTAYATVDSAVTATKWGAFNYLKKPFEVQKLYDTVAQALH